MGLCILFLSESLINKSQYYTFYVILINLGVALITISTVSLVSKYITYSELVKEYDFIHDREKSGLSRIYKNWENCISSIKFNEKLEKANKIVFVGFSHAKTLFALDDEALLKIFKSVKTLEIFVANVDKYINQEKKEYISKRFPVDSSIKSKKRLIDLGKGLSDRQKKKINFYSFDPEKTNVLSIKIIDDITILRLVGIKQSGFNSPFFQFNHSGETQKFIDSYIENLKSVSERINY